MNVKRKSTDEEKVLGDARTALIELFQRHQSGLLSLRNGLCKDVSIVGRPDVRKKLDDLFKMAGMEIDRAQEAEKKISKVIRDRRANVRKV